MIPREHTQKFIYLIVAMNLVVLIAMFIFPRIQFILENRGKGFSQIQETLGARDLPNQYYLSYQNANQIDRIIPKTAVVFLPAKEYPGAVRSVMVQALFPRQVFSADMEDFEKKFNNLQAFAEAYLLSTPDWQADFCPEEKRISLMAKDWNVCRIK